MNARNLELDPLATLRRTNCWHTTVTQREDGRYTYTGNDGSSKMNFSNAEKSIPIGYVQVGVLESSNPAKLITSNCGWATKLAAEVVSDTVMFFATQVTETNVHWFDKGPSNGLAITLLGAAIYSPEDWQTVWNAYKCSDLTTPWSAPPKDATTGLLVPPVSLI